MCSEKKRCFVELHSRLLNRAGIDVVLLVDKGLYRTGITQAVFAWRFTTHVTTAARILFSVYLYLYEYGLGCRMSKQRSHRLIYLGFFVQRFDRIF